MTVEDVRALEAMLHNPTLAASAGPKIVEAAANAPEAEESKAGESKAGEPDAFYATNAAMKQRAFAEYGTATAKLEQALVDLHLLLGENESKALDEAQAHWETYRKALEECAYLEYEGGTHAALAATVRGLGETVRRTAEIEGEAAERTRR
jgi:hypothetical protein